MICEIAKRNTVTLGFGSILAKVKQREGKQRTKAYLDVRWNIEIVRGVSKKRFLCIGHDESSVESIGCCVCMIASHLNVKTRGSASGDKDCNAVVFHSQIPMLQMRFRRPFCPHRGRVLVPGSPPPSSAPRWA